MKALRVEFWWFLEKLSGRLWDRLCPSDKASHWLDWLPAFCYRRRHEAEAVQQLAEYARFVKSRP